MPGGGYVNHARVAVDKNVRDVELVAQLRSAAAHIFHAPAPALSWLPLIRHQKLVRASHHACIPGAARYQKRGGDGAARSIQKLALRHLRKRAPDNEIDLRA